MTPEQFQDALDLRGPRLAQWPPLEAQAATELLLASTTAREALARAEQLDGALAGLLSTPRPAPASLKAAIFDTLPAQQTAHILDFPAASVPKVAGIPASQRWKRLPAAVAAALVVCFVGGICAASIFTGEDEIESIYMSAVYGDLAF